MEQLKGTATCQLRMVTCTWIRCESGDGVKWIDSRFISEINLKINTKGLDKGLDWLIGIEKIMETFISLTSQFLM